MGIGLIVTIIILGSLLGLCARNTIGDEALRETAPGESGEGLALHSVRHSD